MRAVALGMEFTFSLFVAGFASSNDYSGPHSRDWNDALDEEGRRVVVMFAEWIGRRLQLLWSWVNLSVANDAIGKIDCGRSTGSVPGRSCRYRLGG